MDKINGVPKVLVLEKVVIGLARYLFWVLVMLACSAALIVFLLCAWLFSWTPHEIGDFLQHFAQTKTGAILQWLVGLLGLTLIVVWKRLLRAIGSAHLWLLKLATLK